MMAPDVWTLCAQTNTACLLAPTCELRVLNFVLRAYGLKRGCSVSETCLRPLQDVDKKHKVAFQQLVSQILTINRPAFQFLGGRGCFLRRTQSQLLCPFLRLFFFGARAAAGGPN